MTEQAKKCATALRWFSSGNDARHCKKCNYSFRHDRENPCINRLIREAADLIESLSVQLDQVTRERDVAISDLNFAGSESGNFCAICKYNDESCHQRQIEEPDCFEWRGVEVEGC